MFQAQVCMAWLHWSLDDLEALVALLPRDMIRHYLNGQSNGDRSLGWTTVCAIKGGFLLGMHFGYITITNVTEMLQETRMS